MSSFFKTKNGAVLEAFGDCKDDLQTQCTPLSAFDSSLEGKEKHVPVLTMNGNTLLVAVGSTAHPMLPGHFIEWIYVKTDRGAYRKNLRAGEEPKAFFTLEEGEKVVEAYSYCNLHGLWKAD